MFVLHSFSRVVGAIFPWYSYTWTLTFNGGRGSRAPCCLKKLILSLSKCILDTKLVWLVMDLHKLSMCIHVSIEQIGKTTVVWDIWTNINCFVLLREFHILLRFGFFVNYIRRVLLNSVETKRKWPLLNLTKMRNLCSCRV